MLNIDVDIYVIGHRLNLRCVEEDAFVIIAEKMYLAAETCRILSSQIGVFLVEGTTNHGPGELPASSAVHIAELPNFRVAVN